jgi:hypothetical protein
MMEGAAPLQAPKIRRPHPGLVMLASLGVAALGAALIFESF